jgi:hypothetical protein
MEVPDDDESALDALDHDGLVAQLNRLYASAGEHPLSPSAARASTDRELREAIETARRRQAHRKAGGALPPPPPSRRGRVLDRRSDSGRGGGVAGDPDRVLCVLMTADEPTATAARALMRARGVPLVIAATGEALARVLASVTPTHVVIDGVLGETRVLQLLGARAADVRVHWSEGEEPTIAALALVA